MPEGGDAVLDDNLATAVRALGKLAAEKLGDLPEKEFSNLMYDLMHDHSLESAEFFTAVYQALIGKDKGPRLVSFLHVLGRDTVSTMLSRY